MYKISINLVVNSLDEFKKFYKRIMDDIDDFDFFELILLDKTLDDSFYKYYIKNLNIYSNLKYFDGRNILINDLYNKGIELSTGEYLNFTSTSVIYSRDYIYKIGYYLSNENSDIISISQRKEKVCKSSIIDLNDEVYVQSFLEGYYFKRNIISLTRFSLDLDVEISKIKFILDMLIKNNRYLLIKEIKFKIDSNFLNLNKDYYINFIKDFLLDFVKKIESDYGFIPKFIQQYIFNFIVDRYRYNINKEISILNKREEKVFNGLVTKILDYVSDEIIVNSELDKWLIISFLKLKNKEFKFDIIDNYICFNDINTNLISDEVFVVSKIDYVDDELIISGSFSINLDFDILLDIDGCKIISKKENISSNKVFNTEINNNLYIFNIPIKKIENSKKLSFILSYKMIDYDLSIDFDTIFSKLNKSIFSYFSFNNKIMYYKKNKIIISSNNILKMIKKILYYLNINNLFFLFMSLYFKKKNLVVLFEPFKYDYMLDNPLYVVYYIDNDNFNYKDVSFRKIKSSSKFLKLILYNSKLIISNEYKRVIDFLTCKNSFIKANFKSNIIIMPSIKDELNNKRGKDFYNNFIDYIDKLK